MLDGKRHNWATNAFHRKYEPYEVSLCNIHVIPIAFCYFLQASEDSRSDNGENCINILSLLILVLLANLKVAIWCRCAPGYSPDNFRTSFYQTTFCRQHLFAFIFWETVAFQNGVLKNITKFTGKQPCRSFFFNKVTDLKAATSLKKRPWLRCFPVIL